MAKKATQPKVPAPKEPKVKKQPKVVQPKKYVKTFDALQRINRSKGERIFLLTAARDDGLWKFTVQGTKGTNYFLQICQTVKCSCMDFKMKKKPCKHIFFIATQVAQNDQILDYFNNSTSLSKTAYKVFDDQLQTRLKSRLQAMNSKDVLKQIDLKDDKDCVICFSEMQKEVEKLQDCGTCKKYFHQQCIGRWKEHNPTCPLCRGQIKKADDHPMGKLLTIKV